MNKKLLFASIAACIAALALILVIVLPGSGESNKSEQNMFMNTPREAFEAGYVHGGTEEAVDIHESIGIHFFDDSHALYIARTETGRILAAPMYVHGSKYVSNGSWYLYDYGKGDAGIENFNEDVIRDGTFTWGVQFDAETADEFKDSCEINEYTTDNESMPVFVMEIRN